MVSMKKEEGSPFPLRFMPYAVNTMCRVYQPFSGVYHSCIVFSEYS